MRTRREAARLLCAFDPALDVSQSEPAFGRGDGVRSALSGGIDGGLLLGGLRLEAAVFAVRHPDHLGGCSLSLPLKPLDLGREIDIRNRAFDAGSRPSGEVLARQARLGLWRSTSFPEHCQP